MSCADLLQDLGEDEEENDLELKNKKQIGGRKSGATVKELKTKEVLVPSFRVGDDGFSGERGGRRSGRGGRGGDRGDGGRGRGPPRGDRPPHRYIPSPVWHLQQLPVSGSCLCRLDETTLCHGQHREFAASLCLSLSKTLNTAGMALQGGPLSSRARGQATQAVWWTENGRTWQRSSSHQ